MGTLIPTVVIIVSVVFVLLVAMIGFGGKDKFVPNAVPFVSYTVFLLYNIVYNLESNER